MPRLAYSSGGAELPGWPDASGGSAGGGGAPRRLPSDDFATPQLGSSPVAAGLASPSRLSSAAAAAALPPGSPLVAAGAAPRPYGDQREVREAGEAGGAAEAAPAPADESLAGPLPEGLPPLLSPDLAVNAFVTRLAFDLLRRPDFQASGGRPARLLASLSACPPSKPRWLGQHITHGASCQTPAKPPMLLCCPLHCAGARALPHPAPAVPPAAPGLYHRARGGGGGPRGCGPHAAQHPRAAAARGLHLAAGAVRHAVPRWGHGQTWVCLARLPCHVF